MSSILERRAEERYKFVSPIEISWQDASGEEERRAAGTSVNVSLYGAMVEIPDAIPLGTQVRVRIDDNEISSKARVQHCSQIHLAFRIGLRFDRILLSEHIVSLDEVLIPSRRAANAKKQQEQQVAKQEVASSRSQSWRELLYNIARMMRAERFRPREARILHPMHQQMGEPQLISEGT